MGSNHFKTLAQFRGGKEEEEEGWDLAKRAYKQFLIDATLLIIIIIIIINVNVEENDDDKNNNNGVWVKKFHMKEIEDWRRRVLACWSVDCEAFQSGSSGSENSEKFSQAIGLKKLQ